MTARAGHLTALAIATLAVLLLGASSGGPMAALVGRDRVSATYPGFRPNVGDMATLAAMRIPGTTLRGTESMEDSIEIRMVETLSPQQVRAFNGAAAIAAAKPVRNSRTLSIGAVRDITICGHAGFGFTTVDRYDGPDADDPQMFDPGQIGLTAHAVVLIDGDVWQAEYQQGRSGRNTTVGPQMIAFAAHFCIQRHYLTSAKVPR